MAQTYGQCQYEVTAIIQGPPCPFTGPPDTFPLGMNSKGDVVGYYWHCEGPTVSTFAFFRAGDTGEFITLPTPEWALSSRANDINDNRVIVGSHRLPSGIEWRAFVYDLEKQEYTILEPKHGVGTSHGNAINNNNVVAGARSIGEPGQSPNPFNAVIWDTNTGEVVDLGVMNGPNSVLNDLNDDLTSTVGWTGQSSTGIPFKVDQAGNIQFAGASLGIDFGFANGTTSSGRVVGSAAFLNGTNRAFVWEAGKLFSIDPLHPFESSGSFDANDVGQVLVNSSTGLGPRIPGVWQHDILTDVTETLGLPTGVSNVNRGIAINNHGQILSRGVFNSEIVGLVLSPVNRPITDLNVDCVTDLHDLFMLLEAWGPCGGGDCSADFTGNGVVNVFDLLILLGNWG